MDNSWWSNNDKNGIGEVERWERQERVMSRRAGFAKLKRNSMHDAFDENLAAGVEAELETESIQQARKD